MRFHIPYTKCVEYLQGENMNDRFVDIVLIHKWIPDFEKYSTERSQDECMNIKCLQNIKQ